MAKDKISTLKFNDPSDDYSCSTGPKFRTFSFKWTIQNYNFLSKTVELLKSVEFPLEAEENQKWYIEFEPPEITQENENQLEIWLRRKIFDKTIYVQVSLCVESLCGQITFADYNNVLTKEQDILWSLNGKRFYDELNWDKALEKTLIITFKIKILDSTENICRKISVKPLKPNDLPPQDISKLLLGDETFKDVSISVQRKTFKAHKAILAARSEVFSAMFSTEMSEKLNSSIEIKDFKHKTIEQMIRFIYTDKVDDLDSLESASDLLAAAEKYNLKRLKEVCIKFMNQNIKVENVLKILEVADLYSIFDLKKAALNFAVLNSRVVRSKEGFKILIAERPHLMVEYLDIQDNIQETSDNQEIREQIFNTKLDFRTPTS